MERAVDEVTLFSRMRSLDDTEKLSYSERGRICLAVAQTLIHRERINPETGEPCSLTEWIRLAAPWGYSTCYAAMRDVQELQDISTNDLAQIPQANFPTLKKLSTAVRSQPSVLGAAKSLRAAEFDAHIQTNHPDQKIESKRLMRFFPYQAQAADIEEALKLAEENGGATNRTEALWVLAIDYKAACFLEQELKGKI